MPLLLDNAVLLRVTIPRKFIVEEIVRAIQGCKMASRTIIILNKSLVQFYLLSRLVFEMNKSHINGNISSSITCMT